MKKILIVKGHPREKSLCNALVDRYVAGAKTNDVRIKTIRVHDLELGPWLKYDWDRNHESEPVHTADIEKAKKLIVWSDHIVFAYPTYWASAPALLKLFLEVIVVARFAFRYHKPYFHRIPHKDRLLKGRTAALISTMDAPPMLMRLYDQDPGGKMMHDILRFCGIRLTGRYYFGSVVLSSEHARKRWLERAYRIGVRDGR